MNLMKLAILTTCAVALATWSTPRLVAQATTPPQQQGPGQQGNFNGDHEDSGAAGIEGKEGPEVADVTEGKESPEAKGNREVRESASEREIVNSAPDTDRVQDSQADSTPN